MAHVATMWRHPIKSHGREELDAVTLITGQTMSWDRHWAVTHEASKFDAGDPEWIKCRNFMIGAMTPGLAGIWASLDEDSATITLRHADHGSHSFRPDDPGDWAGFLDWIRPLCPPAKRQPTGIASVTGRGMTDTDYASISLMNLASHEAVANHLGTDLEIERWRGNIWLDGPAPWEERSWVGRDVRIGEATLRVTDHIERCKHTMANPRTGLRDTETLSALRNGWGHQDFGIYATVTQGGKISCNGKIEVI